MTNHEIPMRELPSIDSGTRPQYLRLWLSSLHPTAPHPTPPQSFQLYTGTRSKGHRTLTYLANRNPVES